jgi:radical SAM superfamily enzyme YgiQ (UPF0313 family)
MKTYYDAFLGVFARGEVLSLSSAKFASPLGLNVLGTKIKQKFPEIFVRIYNAEINDFNNIIKNVKKVIKNHKKTLIGFTLIAGNVYPSLKLAAMFKKLGCDIIVGGPEIIEKSAKHFSSLPIIDGVIMGFGEHIICDIVKFGLNKQKIFTTPLYFDFQNTSVNYDLLYRLKDYGGVSMLWGGDCHLCQSRCYFCSRQKRGFGWRNPEIVWQELEYPYQQGIRKLYNTADTVAVNIEQLKLLAKTKPIELKEMKIKCFINATQVNEETAELMKQLNAWAAVGIESLSRISVVGKGKTTTDDNYRSIETLAKCNVPIILTFVMGLPGETKKSLKEDERKILDLIQKYCSYLHWITVSPLLITLGSRAFDDCLKGFNGLLPKKHIWEFYNPLLLTEQYFKRFCSVKLNDVYRTIFDLKNKISEFAPKIVFDSKGLDPKRWNSITKIN